MNKPIVAVITDSNFFSIHLVESLLSKSCEIVIFAPDENDWIRKTAHITNHTNLHIFNLKDFNQKFSVTYAVFCLGFLSRNNVYNDFKAMYISGDFERVRSLAIFPKEIFSQEENDALPLNNNLSILYMGDLLAPRMDIESNLRISKIIEQIFNSGALSLGVGEILHPLFAPDAARLIAKWVFSFGPYGREVFVCGQEVSGAEFWKKVNQVIPNTRLVYDNALKPKAMPRKMDREVVNSNLALSLRETFRGVAGRIKVAKAANPSRKRVSGRQRFGIFFLLSILCFPILMLTISVLMLFISYKAYRLGGVDAARGGLYVSRAAARLGKVESGLLKGVPIMGYFYREVDYTLYVGEKLSQISLNGLPAVETAKQLLQNVLGNEVYDPAGLAKSFSLPLEKIYNEISLFEAETKARGEKGELVAARILKEIGFLEVRTLISAGSKFSDHLPEILGKNSRKNYLVLFQNNTELRPTGGFIGSFALLAFEGGRMTDFSVSDVYSADGQLKGHVEPPEPIRKHLQEANWFLRDSNWDPDFPTSAKRAEWFIDKEIDKSVDGVVAVDLGPVRDFLEYTGGIYLADYDMDITSENLYEKVQEEVQEDFFPGTHKKASFLTTLSRNLVTTLANLNDSQKLGILRALYENFESRHIQVYLHNEAAQELVSQVGWDGEVRGLLCGEACYADFLGLVEANVGVNKANYFITRNQELVVDFKGGQLQRNLKITFVNNANPGLGAPAKYKSYVRVIVPKDATTTGPFDITEVRGFKEIGFLVEVLAGQTKQYEISWSSQDIDTETYGIYVRKQAGTNEADGLSVAIEGTLVYNSNLAKDIWIQKP